MKKIMMVLAVIFVTGVSSNLRAASPDYVVETAPYSNETSPVVTISTAHTSAVTVSTFTITRVDSAFNTAATTAIGANFQRAEITVQNNGASSAYCGYSSSGLTTTNSFVIYSGGATWVFKLGKGVAVYCLSGAASSAPLIVGGVAWK